MMRRMIWAIFMNIYVLRNISNIPFRFLLIDLNVYCMQIQGHAFAYAQTNRFSKHKKNMLREFYLFIFREVNTWK